MEESKLEWEGKESLNKRLDKYLRFFFYTLHLLKFSLLCFQQEKDREWIRGMGGGLAVVIMES